MLGEHGCGVAKPPRDRANVKALVDEDGRMATAKVVQPDIIQARCLPQRRQRPLNRSEGQREKPVIAFIPWQVAKGGMITFISAVQLT